MLITKKQKLQQKYLHFPILHSNMTFSEKIHYNR